MKQRSFLLLLIYACMYIYLQIAGYTKPGLRQSSHCWIRKFPSVNHSNNHRFLPFSSLINKDNGMFLVPKYCWCSKIQLQMTLCLGKLGGLVASTTANGRETNSLEQVGAYAAMPFKIWKGKLLGSNAPNSSNYQIYTRIQLAILEFVHPVHASQHRRDDLRLLLFQFFAGPRHPCSRSFAQPKADPTANSQSPIDLSLQDGYSLLATRFFPSSSSSCRMNALVKGIKYDKVLLGYHALCFAISSLMFRLSKGQVALTFNHRSIQAR